MFLLFYIYDLQVTGNMVSGLEEKFVLAVAVVAGLVIVQNQKKALTTASRSEGENRSPEGKKPMLPNS